MASISLERHVEAAKALPRPRLIIGATQPAFASGGTHAHVNPATGRVQAEIPMGGPAEIDRAVAAARAGFTAWNALKPIRRRDALTRLADLVERHFERFVAVAPLEMGMPVSQIGGPQRSRIIDLCKYYAGWADKIEGQVVATCPTDNFEYTIAEPYGVVGHIITWNAPAISLAMKIPACLAAGNAVVIKPAEFTPFTALLFAELALEAGIPEGVVNVVVGGTEAGQALVAHPGIDKISFTGGPDAARHIMAAAARNLRPVLFELGGKSANIVFPDVDLADTAFYSVAFALNNSGQGCALPTRQLVHESIYEEFVARVVGALDHLPTGDPLDPASYLGPVVNEAACGRIMGVIERAKSEKAGRIASGGQRMGGAYAAGTFIEPTIFVDVDPASELAQKEIFGPVIAISPFGSEEEAIRLANGTEYGLSAYVQTNDLNRAHRLAARLRAGTVYVNKATPVNCAAAPFGGINLSGFGREGGKAGLDEFIRAKGVGISVVNAPRS